MIQLVLLVEVNPGKMDFVKEQITLLAKHTRAEEGCISYDAYFSTNNENTISFIESWTDQAALDAHIASKHIADYRANTADCFASRNLNFLERIA